MKILEFDINGRYEKKSRMIRIFINRQNSFTKIFELQSQPLASPIQFLPTKRNIIFTANLWKHNVLISAFHQTKRLFFSALDIFPIPHSLEDIVKCNHPAMKYLMNPTFSQEFTFGFVISEECLGPILCSIHF